MKVMGRCGARRLLQSMVQEGLTGPEPTPDPRRRAAVDALAKDTLPALADRTAAAARLDGSLLAMRCAAAMSLRVGVFTWQARAGRARPLGGMLLLASLHDTAALAMVSPAATNLCWPRHQDRRAGTEVGVSVTGVLACMLRTSLTPALLWGSPCVPACLLRRETAP